MFSGCSSCSVGAPVYKTPALGGYGYGLGLTGAIGGISASFPSSYPPALPSYSASYSAPYSTPLQYSAPVSPVPYTLPSYAASVSRVSVAPPIQYSAPPQVQYIEAPPVCLEAPPPLALTCAPTCAPTCTQYVEAPPVILQLPAPMPPLPAPLPPPPSVIHIKDDSAPKIASLQAEIRRLERLLAAAKEAEAGLRAEMAELQTRLEILAQKEAQHAACEAEVAKLREQLLEAQRRITFLEGQRDEAHKHIAFLENQLKAADAQIAQMAARIRQLEAEIANLQARLAAKQEIRSQTNVHETYKVKSFEVAAKLAVMDGTDDGMYNGLPIEVEGEGLYKDLVAKGRRPQGNVSLTGRPSSVTTTSETYKVQSFEMAEKLSKMSGLDDGKYNGLPIEVSGEGLYTDLVRRGRRSSGPSSVGGTFTTSSITGGQTYKVSNMEMAAKISKMGGADDGTYKGLPIEVQGLGLYKDLRGRM